MNSSGIQSSFFFLLVLLLLSPQIQARHFRSTHNVKKPQVLLNNPKASEPAPQEPAFFVDRGDGYGLYGSDSTTSFDDHLLTQEFISSDTYNTEESGVRGEREEQLWSMSRIMKMSTNLKEKTLKVKVITMRETGTPYEFNTMEEYEKQQESQWFMPQINELMYMVYHLNQRNIMLFYSNSSMESSVMILYSSGWKKKSLNNKYSFYQIENKKNLVKNAF